MKISRLDTEQDGCHQWMVWHEGYWTKTWVPDEIPIQDAVKLVVEEALFLFEHMKKHP